MTPSNVSQFLVLKMEDFLLQERFHSHDPSCLMNLRH